MTRLVALLCIVCLIATQSTALAGVQSEEARAAAEAANAFARGAINPVSAQEHVPGYTPTPPQAAHYDRPNLTDAAQAELAACAATPNDPICQALQGATASAQTPREPVPAEDPAVVDARAIAANPTGELGDATATYRDCTATATPTAECPARQFCLGELCFAADAPPDPDFAQVSSFLEAGREAGVYLDPDSLEVFQGEANRCRDRLLKNCCDSDPSGAGMTNQSLFGTGSKLVYDILMNAQNRQFITQGFTALLTGSGFSGAFSAYGVTVAVNGAAIPAGSVALYSGQSLIIAFDPWTLAIAVVIYVVMQMMSCEEDEGLLAMKEGAGLCHTLGDYCSSCIRVLGSCVSCIERTTGKCCFNSVLARVIHEQARAQFGKGWGTAREPDCSGFTVAQLQAMDFAAMDLTEFYASLQPTLPDVEALREAHADRALKCYYGEGQCR